MADEPNSTTVVINEGNAENVISEQNQDSVGGHIGDEREPDSGAGDGDLSASDIEREPSGDESDTVTVARINSERDITLGALAAETERARIEASSEAAHSANSRSEIEEAAEKWHEEAESLREAIRQTEERIMSILQPPSVEMEIAETETGPSETVQEPSLTPNSTADPIAEIATGLSDANEEAEEAAEEVVAKVRRYIPL